MPSVLCSWWAQPQGWICWYQITQLGFVATLIQYENTQCVRWRFYRRHNASHLLTISTHGWPWFGHHYHKGTRILLTTLQRWGSSIVGQWPLVTIKRPPMDRGLLGRRGADGRQPRATRVCGAQRPTAFLCCSAEMPSAKTRPSKLRMDAPCPFDSR